MLEGKHNKTKQQQQQQKTTAKHLSEQPHQQSGSLNKQSHRGRQSDKAEDIV